MSGWIRPARRDTTKDALGKAKAGLWTVELCSDGIVNRKIARQRITREAPSIPFLPNALAQDLLLRAAARDGRSFLGANGDALLGLSSGVASAVGVAAKSPAAGYVGIGMVVGQVILRLLSKGAPNPSPYFASLLADEVVLTAGDCREWTLVSGLMRDPEPVKIIVHFPPANPVTASNPLTIQ